MSLSKCNLFTHFRYLKICLPNKGTNLYHSKAIFKPKEHKSPSSRSKQNCYFYLNDPVSADSIAFHLCENWTDGYIFELNPGPGVLSKAILTKGAAKLRVFEKNEKYLDKLKDLSHSHPNLEIVEEDFLFLPSFESKPLSNHLNVVESFFDRIPVYPWDDRISFRFFSIISSKKSVSFFRFLLAVLPNRTSLFSHGRCEFYLLLSDSEYMYIKAEPKENLSTYRWCTVLYNLFFEIKFLKEFPCDICMPMPSLHSKRKVEGNHFYFMKLTPKADLFTSVVNGNRLPDFYFFIRHHLSKRTSLVIPAMEGWIPFCGPRLIKEGMNVFTKFGDLSPEQLLLLFNRFSSWPEYEESVFHAALQRFYGKGPLLDEEDETV